MLNNLASDIIYQKSVLVISCAFKITEKLFNT